MQHETIMNFCASHGFTPEAGTSLYIFKSDKYDKVFFDLAQCNQYGSRYSFSEDIDPSCWVDAPAEILEAIGKDFYVAYHLRYE